VDKPLKSVTHGQYDNKPTVTFLAAGHHRPLTDNKLYCSVTEAHVCEHLPKVDALITTPPQGHDDLNTRRRMTFNVVRPLYNFLLVFHCNSVDTIPACDRQTDGHATTTYTALA